MQDRTNPACAIKSWRSSWRATLLLLGPTLLVTLGATARAKTTTTRARANAVEATAAPTKSYGSSSAPITMEVYTDYECPVCRNLYEETLRPLINDYVASGKVYLVHHDFPLPNHRYGYEAARWVNAAARVGDFQIAEAAMYDNQSAWAADGDIQKYIAAVVPASDMKRIEKLMAGCDFNSRPDAPGDACALDSAIDQDRVLGNTIPVQATPTYVITYKGQRLPAGTGVVSWPILKQFFDSLLKQ